ncbi:hypothetical protein FC27_GL001087 [Companilactobacillus versmoldensis DSM 14857 = KCTC 3814]|uniref:Uncharacterized protein n=2 Tax=Companilactobacillus versmoldensis TaxID=194326 RepID=A0A0R1SAN1_9LACO|nr:hypothetical protein FC27_GL001087 [Companilactobacillus versmoldensis DSM 14857 = KCTC 3814]
MGIFGGIIVIIAVAIFFSYQSYSNISLSNDSQMTPNKTDKNNKTASKKTSKNNNIFLQDKDNPDHRYPSLRLKWCLSISFSSQWKSLSGI